MKEKIVYVLKRVRNVLEITLVVYLIYTLVITISGVGFLYVNNSSLLIYDIKQFYLNSYLRHITASKSFFEFFEPAFKGQLALEIILFSLPAIICIAREVFIRRERIVKWFKKIPTTSKKVKELEKQIEELKKEKH